MPNVPPLRFPEFTGEWVKCTLNDLGTMYNGLSGKSRSDFGEGLPYITYKSIFDSCKVDLSRVEYVEITDKELQEGLQNKVKKGDIFFTTSSETPDEVGMASVLLDEIENCFLNSFCFGYRLNSFEEVYPNFMQFYLRSNIVRKKLFILAQGSTRFNISKIEVGKMKIKLPALSEQKKISQLLETIESRISTQIRVIDKLESLIKGIRATVFNNVQPNTKLGEIADIYQPQTIASTECNRGQYLVFGANGVIGRYEQYNHEQPQICITCRGNTCGTVNFSEPFSWVTGNAMVINIDNNKEVNKRYLFHYLSSQNFHHIISGSGQPQIVRSPLLKFPIYLPSMQTQVKLAEMLDLLRCRLKTEQDILEKYQQQKAYLLQNMFI